MGECAMTEDEVRAKLRSYGWNWCVHTRRGQKYLYARRRRKPLRTKFEERYIAPVSRLPELSAADIVAKLTRA